MSSKPTATVEINHANIVGRMDILDSMLSTLMTHTEDHISKYRTDNMLKIAQRELDDLQNDYSTGSCEHLIEYRKNESRSTMYFSFINSECVAPRLSQCLQYIEECNEVLGGLVEIGDMRAQFNRSHVHTPGAQPYDFETCTCGQKMVNSANSNEIICYPCGSVREIHGDPNDEFVIQNGDTIGIKHGKYDPSRRCKFWIERIQGRETANIPDSCIKDVTACIERDNLDNEKSIVRCLQIRDYLKETGHTSYNDHVTLIRKMITGYTPPHLTENELQIVYHLFNKVITIFDEIKPAKKYNSPYYPYLVGKILFSVLPPGRRKRHILECIHMQSSVTLISNDRLMKTICLTVPEITYTPTIRSDFTIMQ